MGVKRMTPSLTPLLMYARPNFFLLFKNIGVGGLQNRKVPMFSQIASENRNEPTSENSLDGHYQINES